MSEATDIQKPASQLKNALIGVKRLESGGRPKYKIDWDIVARFAQQNMNCQQIAACMGVDENVLGIECKKEHSRTFGQWVEAHQEGGKQSLRQKLMQMAVEDGNAQVAIHLSKHWLGMHDRKDVNVQSSHTLHLEALRDHLQGKIEGSDKDLVDADYQVIDNTEQSDDAGSCGTEIEGSEQGSGPAGDPGQGRGRDGE